MKTTTLGWILGASLAIGACNTSGTSGTGTESTATATGTKPATVAETAREKAADALSAAAAVVKPRRQVELAAGTTVAVRTTHALSTVSNQAHDPFTATLDEPVVVNDVEVLPRGTKFTGHVTSSDASGRLEGRAVGVGDAEELADHGRRKRIREVGDDFDTAAIERGRE